MLLRVLLIGCISLLLEWTGLTQKTLAVEDIYASNKIKTRTITGFNFLKDGIHYSRIQERRIELYDMASGKKVDILFDKDSVTLRSDSGDDVLNHGMADDNVHFHDAVEMASALIKANEQFDTYYYPNRNHGIYGGNTRLHLFTKMTDFILKNI